jgi:hypothetical protein
VLDGALALDQHACDLAAQLLDFAALVRQSGEPQIAVVAHQALDHGIGRGHGPLEQAGVKPDAGHGWPTRMLSPMISARVRRSAKRRPHSYDEMHTYQLRTMPRR